MFRAIRVPALVLAVAFVLGACSGEPGRSASPVVSCTIPADTYDDLAACAGPFEFLEWSAGDSVRAKSSAKIVIASRDPNDILAGLGAYTREWGLTDSFVVLAYGSNDPSIAGRFNRGRLAWKDRGPITIEICTAFAEIKGTEVCTDQMEFTVSNRDASLPPLPQPRQSLLDRERQGGAEAGI